MLRGREACMGKLKAGVSLPATTEALRRWTAWDRWGLVGWGGMRTSSYGLGG